MAYEKAQPTTPLSANAKGKQRAQPVMAPQSETPMSVALRGMMFPTHAPTLPPPHDESDPAASMMALHKYRLNAIQSRNWSTWLGTENEWAKRLKVMDNACDPALSPAQRSEAEKKLRAGKRPEHSVTDQQKLANIHKSLSAQDMSHDKRQARLDRTMDIILGRARGSSTPMEGSIGGQENPIAMESSDEYASQADEMSGQGYPPGSGKITPKSAASKRARKKKMSTQTLLTDPRSPLASADIRAMLCDPKNWMALSDAEQEEIAGLLPSRSVWRCPRTNKGFANVVKLRNDDGFRHACATYATQLKEGLHDEQWLAEAWAASSRRKKGAFDEYLVKKFEEDWGMKIPHNLLPKRLQDKGGNEAEADAHELDGPVEVKETEDQHAFATGNVALTQLHGPTETWVPQETDAPFGTDVNAGDPTRAEGAVVQAQQNGEPRSADHTSDEAMNLITSTEIGLMGKTGDKFPPLVAEAGSGHRIAGELMDQLEAPSYDSAGSKVPSGYASNSVSRDTNTGTSRNTTIEGSMSMDLDEVYSPNIDAESKVEAETPGTSTSPVTRGASQGAKRKRVSFDDEPDELAD